MTGGGGCTAPRLCAVCDEPLRQRPDERPDRFLQRKFCSQVCRGAAAGAIHAAIAEVRREDFLHEVWFFRTWFGWSDARIATRLGMSWEAFHARMVRAETRGVELDVDRWAAA